MKYVFANWKMYCGPDKSTALAAELARVKIPEQVTAAIFPTSLSFQSVKTLLVDTPWQLGAQNIAWTPEGAYTGAVSAEFFRSAGAEYALVGHSERRHIFNETDPDTHKKMEACLKAGVTPVLCVGETAEDKEANKRQYRLKKQLMVALENLNLNGSRIIIAYEPVWAIHSSGTGESCTPSDVADVLGWIADEVKQYNVTNPILLYGGSVTKDNAKDYYALSEVQGVLVGSASTHADDLSAILSVFGSY